MNKVNGILECKTLFFIMSFYVGLWTIRMPDIKDQLNTDYIGIGYIMVTFAIGSVIAMLLANQIIKKTSIKSVLMYSSIFQGLFWLPVAFIDDLKIFMLITFIFGLSYGAFEIACNLYVSKIEKRENKSLMAGFHAFWSLGVLFGSLITSLFLEIKISLFINILFYVSILLPLSLYSVIHINEKFEQENESKKSIFFVWPLFIFLLAFIAMANALTEGSIDAWGSLYMRDYIKVDGFQIGIATLSFNIFMVIGRLTGDRIRDKIGVFNLLIILFFITIFSLYILNFFNSITSSILGFSLLGLGSSSIIPITYSLAAKIKGIESGVSITIISLFVYGTFIGAPAGLGFVANSFGINNIFIPLLIAFIILIMPILLLKKEFKL